MQNDRPIIGIDLGTTRSVAAHVGADGHVTCLPGRDGEVLTPSCVFINDDGEAVVGRAAIEAGLQSGDRMIDAFKRHLDDDDWSWSVNGKKYTAPALSALVLRRLVEDAERVIGPIGGAIVTVPAYFGDRQRSATFEAAALAELNVLGLVNEPTAAALAGAFEAYVAAGGDGADLTTAAIASTAPGISVLCDLGGGTLDVTVIRIDGHRFDILASGGKRLGGRDFDEYIIEAIYRHIFDCNGPDPYHDPAAVNRMRLAAEKAKHTLTVKSSVEITPPYPRVPAMTLSREQFEADSVKLVDQARDVIQSVMIDAQLTWAHVDSLLLVGGASRMPMFRRMAGQVSGLTPEMRLQPDLIVAHGAAVYAAILRAGHELRHAGVTTQDINQPIGWDTVPTGSSDGYLEALAGASSYEPGFAAAAGAVEIRDVTSQSLGAIVYSPSEERQVNSVIVPRNSRLPAMRSRVFGTHDEDQRQVVVPIVEGDQREPDDCTPVGRCVIRDLPPGLPRGSRVEVTFSYDASGRVCVRAEELSTHRAAQTVLERQTAAHASPIDDLAGAVAQVALASH